MVDDDDEQQQNGIDMVFASMGDDDESIFEQNQENAEVNQSFSLTLNDDDDNFDVSEPHIHTEHPISISIEPILEEQTLSQTERDLKIESLDLSQEDSLNLNGAAKYIGTLDEYQISKIAQNLIPE